MKNNQKGFSSLILVGVIVVLTVVGGYFVWSKKSNQATKNVTPNPVSQEVNNTETKIPTPVPKDETFNWKTYTNTEYGFDFKYPSGLFYAVDTSARNLGWFEVFAGIGTTGALNIDILKEKSENGKDDIGFGIGNNIKQIKIGDKVGYQATVNDLGCKVTYIETDLGQNTLAIVFNACHEEKNPISEDIDLINQILSTFKFTK